MLPSIYRGVADLLAALEWISVDLVDLGVTSNLDHLHADILLSCTVSAVSGKVGKNSNLTDLDGAVVGVNLSSWSDWANPL